jgi:competence protein ComEC
VIQRFVPEFYVDNGRDLEAAGVVRARTACRTRGVDVRVVEPANRKLPFNEKDNLKLTPVAPTEWHQSCSVNPNNCSIGLRIDYCQSSVLFTGDAEEHAERELDTGGEVTLLQVGHHGSDTSSSAAFLEKAKPKYAVISSGKPGVGTNRTYCHPRARTVERLTAALGGAGSRAIRAFDAGVACRGAKAENWVAVPASDRLWVTARDGDVVLATNGDGVFSVPTSNGR